MGYRVATPEPEQFIDASGNPIVGGTIEFYLTGTTTPAAVYSDSAGTPLGTSVTLNARGEPQTSGGTAVNIFYDEAVTYKRVRKNAEGETVAPTQDPFSVGQGEAAVTATGSVTDLALAAHFALNLDLVHFGGSENGATDNTAALTAALAATDLIHIRRPGTYALSTMITVAVGKCVRLGQDVTLKRLTSLSAATTPVIWLRESGATLEGVSRNNSSIETQNAAPNGVVRIGFEDETETGRNIRNCRLSHIRVKGSTGDGQTSGDPDVAVYVPCASAEINYYHTLDDIFVTDVNHGIWLHGESNGHNISRIFGEALGNATLDGVLLYFQGGSDCTVSQAFMSGNGASGSGAIMLKFSNLGASRSTHNTITGLVGEMGVNGLLVESTDTTTSAPVSNYIQGVDNTGGVNVNDDFWTNNFAAINDYPSTKGGFRFPLTPAPVSGSNILDYYSETQTYSINPAINSATPGIGRDTTVNHAKWTRIGNICFISLRVTMATLGSGGSGNVRITNGLPFTCISDSGNYLGGMSVPNYENLAANVRTIQAAAYPGSTDIAIYITTGDATANAQMDFATYVQATTQFYITGFYVVA